MSVYLNKRQLMFTRQFRVVRYLALCQVACLCLSPRVAWAHQPRPVVEELPILSRISSIHREGPWVSDHQVFFVDTDNMKEEGQPNCFPCLLDVLSGKRTPLPALYRNPSEYPWFPSPDGKRVLFNAEVDE